MGDSLKTFEYQMEVFGYDIELDVFTCTAMVMLFKDETKVYEYRASPFIYSPEWMEVNNLKVLEELLTNAYWAYYDYLELEEKSKRVKSYIKKSVPKHLVIKRHPLV